MNKDFSAIMNLQFFNQQSKTIIVSHSRNNGFTVTTLVPQQKHWSHSKNIGPTAKTLVQQKHWSHSKNIGLTAKTLVSQQKHWSDSKNIGLTAKTLV